MTSDALADEQQAASQRPLRIALVTTELRPGGAERCLTNLAVGLCREKFAPRVIVLAPPPPRHQRQLVAQLAQAGLPVDFIGVEKKWQFFTAVRRLRSLLQRSRIDLVQSFLFHANVVSAVAAGRLRIPVVAGLRVSQLGQWFRPFVERRLQRRVVRFVCVSAGVQLSASAGGIDSERLHIIPNGIDISQWPAEPATPEALGLAAGRRMVLFVGRLHRQKGVDVLLKAWARAAPQLPRHDLVIVGEGESAQSLRQLASSLQIDQRVVFSGWRDDVPSLLSAADLLVLPSRWEGMPNVLLEAMASGIPFVATEAASAWLCPAQPHPLAAGEDADLTEQQVVAGENDLQLADAIVRIAADPELSQRLGEANRQHVEEHFALSKMIISYEELYHDVCKIKLP